MQRKMTMKSSKSVAGTYHHIEKFIVSQDKHFGILRDIDFPKLDVIDIDTFQHILKGI